MNTTIKTGVKDERGSATVIALFVLALISVFVAMALTRSAAEAAATGNETADGRTFYAAQGSLETMTRNFNKIFEVRLNPTSTELNAVRTGSVAGLTGYTFDQTLTQTSVREVKVLPGGPFAGLYAVRDNWQLETTATNNIGVQTKLTRNILNNRIPIFQFGIFYDDDLELYRPPRFSFGGRVHSNRHFFVSPGPAGVYFNSRVTAVGHIITQTWRNHFTGDTWAGTYIKNASAVDKQLLPAEGSVLNTTAGAADNIFASDPDMPPSKLNPNFTTQSAIFDGNLQNLVPELKLPIKIDSAAADLREMVQRGKKIASAGGGDLFNNAGTLAPVVAANEDSDILREERLANKPGIRVSLADSKAKLPGCASGVGTAAITGACGVRLDGDRLGMDDVLRDHTTLAFRSRGYQPKPMRGSSGGAFDYIPTRLNGERFYSGREVWIKVETVQVNAVNGTIDTKDITQDFLSLGVTEQAPAGIIDIVTGGYNESPLTSSLTATGAQSVSSGGTDSRSIIKLQRFAIRGPNIPNDYPGFSAGILWSFGSGSGSVSAIHRYTGVDDAEILTGCASGCTNTNGDPLGADDLTSSDSFHTMERYGHLKRATGDGSNDHAIVPFPIKMFDSREGQHYDDNDPAYYDDVTKLTRNGVMSMIDIDVANMRRFLRGDFNGLFPIDTPFATANGGTGLTATNIPQNAGWVLYVSDRRGDADFDGEFDMEDVYGAGKGNDGNMQPGEDVNRDGVLNTSYDNEAEKYNTNEISPNLAAVYDHKYYRRGVRLINGTTIPGFYDSSTAQNTRGFTVSSENGLYVQGNYNATGVVSVPSTGNTPYNEYLPFDTNLHIPASIVADAVTILSNNWNDAQSFASPYDQNLRRASETTIRFAMISGDTIASKYDTPHQGGIGQRMNGGVHNFKRFLERWTQPGGTFSVNLNYAGSLINLFNSQANNGTFKCCNTVYNPPVRNWVFDSTFLDPDRLPPATPYFQYIQTTGFQRTND